MKVPDTKENLMKCICMGCPSYDDCMKKKTEGLFCSRGRSVCKIEEIGCICGECSLTSEYNLASLYYCSKGSEE